MAIERVVRCDFDGEFVALGDRRRVAVRRDEDRPESAEYVDVCVACRKRSLAELIEFADKRRPEADYPQSPPGIPVMCSICGWDVRAHPASAGHAPVPETANGNPA